MSDLFERLDETTKFIIRMLEQNQTPFSNEFKAQNTIIAKLHHESRLHASKEHEKTRAEIIQAINTRRTSNRDSNEIEPRLVAGQMSEAKKTCCY